MKKKIENKTEIKIKKIELENLKIELLKTSETI